MRVTIAATRLSPNGEDHSAMSSPVTRRRSRELFVSRFGYYFVLRSLHGRGFPFRLRL